MNGWNVRAARDVSREHDLEREIVSALAGSHPGIPGAVVTVGFARDLRGIASCDAMIGIQGATLIVGRKHDTSIRISLVGGFKVEVRTANEIAIDESVSHLCAMLERLAPESPAPVIASLFTRLAPILVRELAT